MMAEKVVAEEGVLEGRVTASAAELAQLRDDLDAVRASLRGLEATTSTELRAKADADATSKLERQLQAARSKTASTATP